MVLFTVTWYGHQSTTQTFTGAGTVANYAVRQPIFVVTSAYYHNRDI